jgi:SAM-dependent methyltransferase
MSIDQASPEDSTYVLGHGDAEIERLLLQGRVHNDFTEHALWRAGLRPGMRVLDVGCGPGDVSMIAARLVGPHGVVLGVDAAAEVIELARARAAAEGLKTVRFAASAIADIRLDAPVDAVIGRLILVHLPDPVAALRRLAALVRPGGLVVFCETDLTGGRTAPDLPTWRAVTSAVANIFESAGFDPMLGATLHTMFRRAGLGRARLALGAPVGAADDADMLAYVVGAWRSMYPAGERLGLIPDELVDLDAVTQRLRDEAAGAQALAVMPPLVCDWSRV